VWPKRATTATSSSRSRGCTGTSAQLAPLPNWHLRSTGTLVNRRLWSLVEIFRPDAFDELVELRHQFLAVSLVLELVTLGDDDAFRVE
jgi:hypothetical protein